MKSKGNERPNETAPLSHPLGLLSLDNLVPPLQPDKVGRRSTSNIVLRACRPQLGWKRSNKVGERQLGDKQSEEDELHRTKNASVGQDSKV